MRSHSPPLTAIFFAFLGLAWCVYIAFLSTHSGQCITSGCALFRDSRIAGISLWWVGGFYFFLLAALCLCKNLRPAQWLAGTALLADAVLLLIMFFSAPCFDCLVVAAFMGLVYYSVHNGPNRGWFLHTSAPSLLLPIWFGLFLGNTALAVNEQIPLYSLGNARSSEMRIFFSPSCPACNKALLLLGSNAVLYPITEIPADFDSVTRLAKLLKADVPMKEALQRCLDPAEPVPPLPFYTKGLLSVQLLRNKAAVFRQGFRALPLIQINGMPQGRAFSSAPPKSANAAPASRPLRSGLSRNAVPTPRVTEYDHDGEGLPEFLRDAGSLTRCDEKNPQPCRQN